MKLKTLKRIFIITEIALWSIGLILYCIPNNKNTTIAGLVFVIIAILVIIAYIIFLISRKGASMAFEQQKEYNNYFTFIQSTGLRGNRLFIKHRGSIINEAVKIEADRDYTYKGVPDKLIYTGATVGGVTTGGFHVQKGGIAITSMKKNGKFFLSYALIPSYEYKDPTLDFIELTASDFKEFQKTRINHLVTSEEKKKDYKLTGKNIIDASGLSKDAAYALKDWLCGQNI